MAVSKRLRYEILRRDSHTCRYCGASAPDVKLAVDHVIPVALGGSDEPSNLIAACEPCNSGKSATAADTPIVADVDHRAAQWSSAMRRAADEINADALLLDSVCQRVDEIMPGYRPKSWRSSIQNILAAGLPEEAIVDMAHVAMDTYGVGDRWKYFFGCCWTRVRKLQERASELLDAPNDAQAYAPSNATSTCSEPPLDAGVAMDIWADQNARHRELYGVDQPKCMCPGECKSDHPAVCTFGIAVYMSGWMDHEYIHGRPEKPSEVTDGTALDPA